jgi:DNA-binding beta-propeller fold protein YncE
MRSVHRGVVVLVAVAAAVVLGGLAVAVSGSQQLVRNGGRSPAQLTADSTVTRHFEYVVSAGGLHVYSIDRGNRLVQTVSLPELPAGFYSLHGVVADTRHEILYVSYGQQKSPGGSLLAFDLGRGRLLWHHTYRFGIDSMALSRNGRFIYMPAGEMSGSGLWRIIAAGNGRPTGGVIHGPQGAHNTILGPDGRYLYLAGVDYPYLEVARTATNTVIRKIGPLNRPGVRPFTINDSQTLAFTTSANFLGFQVSSIVTGKVLYTVPVPGFSFDPKTFRYTPDHGIALSPDGRQLYLIDTPNGYVHVFDVSGLPGSPPRLITSIKLHHPPPRNGWLQYSRDGRYLYVGRAGDVIDTRRRRIVDYLPSLGQTGDSLEIDWQHGKPVFTTTRYGVG